MVFNLDQIRDPSIETSKKSPGQVDGTEGISNTIGKGSLGQRKHILPLATG